MKFNSKWKKKSFILIPPILILIALMFLIPNKEALVFHDSEQVLAYIPLSEGNTFKIKYTHSIHLSDVIESYEILKDLSIRQYELQYEDFAVGMPADASAGETFEVIEGKYYIKNMNRVFSFFDLRVGQVRANHTVLYKNKEYPLSSYIEPGTRVRVIAKKINLLQRMEGVNILE